VKQVLSKVNHMTTAFRDAHEWATGVTGAGVLADEGKLSWKNKVRSRFDYYYEVVDIMADRAGSMPKCTNDDLRNLDLDDDDDGPDSPYVEDDDDDLDDEDNDDESVAVVDDSVAPVVVAAAAGAVPPVPPSVNKKAPPTSEGKKKPHKRGGRAPLMDAETLKAFASSNYVSAKQFREERCHNQRVEDFDNCRLILEEKAAAAHKLATHVGYVAARVKSVSQYHELKAAGCSDEQIIQIIPNLIDIVEIITGKKFACPTINVDESSDNGGGKPAAKETPERHTSPRRQTRNNGK